MKKTRKQRPVATEDVADKMRYFLQQPATDKTVSMVISFMGRRRPGEAAAIITRLCSRLAVAQLRNLELYIEGELQKRARKGDAEARESILEWDACHLDQLRQLKGFKPKYYRKAEKKLDEIIPDRPRQPGNVRKKLSLPTRVAYLLVNRAATVNMQGGQPLPRFCKANYKLWLPFLRSVFEHKYGKDFENHDYFKGYWQQGSQHEQTERWKVRNVIWRAITQSIRTIAND